jgi:hypothetical protein
VCNYMRNYGENCAQDCVNIIDHAMRREHSAEYSVALGLADLVSDQVGQQRQDLVTDQVDIRVR